MMVAVLLANSVKQATNAVSNMAAAAGGTSARGWRWPPIHEARPDSWEKTIRLRSKVKGHPPSSARGNNNTQVEGRAEERLDGKAQDKCREEC